MDAEKFYTDRQLAERYSVSRQTIWMWARTERLPAPVRFSPQCSRWKGSAILEHERRLTAEVCA